MLKVLSGVNLSIGTSGLGIYSCRRRSSYGVLVFCRTGRYGIRSGVDLGELSAMCPRKFMGQSDG